MKPLPEEGRNKNGQNRFLRQPPFCHLSATWIAWLQAQAAPHLYGAGRYPVPQDHTFARIELIVRGTADLVTRDNSGQEAAFRRLAPDELYGFTALFCEGLALFGVRAVTDLEVLSLARTDFERVIRRNAAARDYLFQEAMLRIRQAYLEAGSLKAQAPRVPDTCAVVTARLEKPLAYIQANSEKPLTLEEVAATGGMSPYYFSRLFKSLMGSSFKAYLNRIRIEAAKDMLQKKDMNVSEVCYAAGYNDLSYFTRVFKKLEGETPSGYRRRVR